MIHFEFETKEFDKSFKKFRDDCNVITPLAVKKVAFDLLAGILGGGLTGGNFSFKGKKIGSGKYAGESYGNVVTGRHPVDTGRARAGWNVSIQGLGGKANLESGGKNIKPEAIAKGKSEGQFTDGTNNLWNPYVELTNAVPYIVYLEYGHSAQAPAGMVRVAARKMRGKLPKLLTQEYVENWNKFNF